MSQALSQPDATVVDELIAVHAFYTALAPGLDPERGLGGQLLYAGLLDPAACNLLRAANIAGAASLAASDSPEALRQALRDGVIDFLVTSLDEALRILKNEIRKRQPVAVGISAPSAQIGEEMMLRGVQPDLLPLDPAAIEPPCARESFLARGARPIEPLPLPDEIRFRIWQVPVPWAQRISQLDARLLAQLPADAHSSRRWLGLAPRYLSAKARRLRSLACNETTAAQLQNCMDSLPSQA